jgi:hypothetical protein
MSIALDRGLNPGLNGCLRIRTTYEQFYFSNRAIALALIAFDVEKRISFLAKVHGQSVLRHGQSFARHSRFQRTLGERARIGHGLQTPTG